MTRPRDPHLHNHFLLLMITIKNICTTFSTLENGCGFYLFWLTVTAMKTDGGAREAGWVGVVRRVDMK